MGSAIKLRDQITRRTAKAIYERWIIEQEKAGTVIETVKEQTKEAVEVVKEKTEEAAEAVKEKASNE